MTYLIWTLNGAELAALVQPSRRHGTKALVCYPSASTASSRHIVQNLQAHCPVSIKQMSFEISWQARVRLERIPGCRMTAVSCKPLQEF